MALVRKILESVLSAGQTSVSFNDSDIPNSLIRVYASKADLFPVKQTLTGNVITIEYEAQSSNVGIALEIVKQGLDIVDDLTTQDNTKALSANQGYVLKNAIDTTSNNLSDLAEVVGNLDIPDKITDLDDVDVNDIDDGQVLAWNSTTEKFENVNQSGGGGAEIVTITKSMTANNSGYFSGFTDEDGNSLDPDEYILFDISATTSSQYYLGLPFVLNGGYLARMQLALVPSYVEYVKTAITLDVRYSYIKK